MTVRTSQLDEVGDLGAPIGSRAWAIAIRDEINSAIHDVEFATASAETYCRLMRDHEGWKQLADGKQNPFTSFEHFSTTRKPFGLGYDASAIERIFEERAKRLAQTPEVRR